MYLDKSVRFVKARKTREVELPELGTVIVRELSVSQMASIGEDRVKQLAMMIVDPDGNQVFTTESDLANLSEMPISASKVIFETGNELIGVSKAAQDETTKN